MMPRLLAPLLLALLAGSPAQADELIYLTDPAGTELFDNAEITTPYFKLASYLESERILTFCGPATIAAVMNSLDVKRPVPEELFPFALFTQDDIFTAKNQAVKSYPQVEHDGLVLTQLAQFFINLGTKAEFHHADEFDADDLRETIKTVLADPSKRLVVNYTRKPLNQIGDGHISPVAAYDADTDRVLILDVARYKYPPVWLTVADLYGAMDTVDSGSQLKRGIVIVSQ
jgi:hypothetical protein